jgi:hypothetical protein
MRISTLRNPLVVGTTERNRIKKKIVLYPERISTSSGDVSITSIKKVARATELTLFWVLT